MITHLGPNVTNGHYVAFCQGPEQNQGFRCDDEKIRDVSYQEVMHSEPYMLFYRGVK